MLAEGVLNPINGEPPLIAAKILVDRGAAGALIIYFPVGIIPTDRYVSNGSEETDGSVGNGR